MKKWWMTALAVFMCSLTWAQSPWPSRPIKLLVPYPAGGSTDILARLLGQKLSEALAQPVVIENKGGASGGQGNGNGKPASLHGGLLGPVGKGDQQHMVDSILGCTNICKT